MEFPCGDISLESCTQAITDLINACNNPDTNSPAVTSMVSFIPFADLPEEISTSPVVDVMQLEAFANINGQRLEMDFDGVQFFTSANVPANSQVSFDLFFQETLPDGQILILAELESTTISVDSVDVQNVVTGEIYSYDFDDDGDGLSNIVERNGAAVTPDSIFCRITPNNKE